LKSIKNNMPVDSKHNIKVLFVAAEAAPLIKIGGLGDYIGSLPKALQEASQHLNENISLDIRIAIPYSKMMDHHFIEKIPILSFSSKQAGNNHRFDVYSMSLDRIVYYILDNKDMEDEEDIVYAANPAEDGEKFIAFSLACLDLMQHLKWHANIIHANDWQTGILCSVLKHTQKESFKKTKSIFVIHNLPYMGTGAEPIVQKYKIKGVRAKNVPKWGKNLPLVIGIEYSDQLVTVSPRYAQEILTPQFGNDLQDYLLTKKDKIVGILNGIDVEFWNPQTDAYLHTRFSTNGLNARRENKLFIQKSLGLPQDKEIPLLVFVGRLDRQKGIRLLCDTLRHFTDQRWQAVILGTGSRDQEELVFALEMAFPDSVRFLNRFDTAYSHLLPAGGDIYLMPSLYEPCGISQMIAMHYGCIPVAHAVGGLMDSINDTEEKRTGFLFYLPERQAFLATLEQAFQHYYDTAAWVKIQKRAMEEDFSWKKSAMEYLKIYQRLAQQS